MQRNKRLKWQQKHIRKRKNNTPTTRNTNITSLLSLDMRSTQKGGQENRKESKITHRKPPQQQSKKINRTILPHNR